MKSGIVIIALLSMAPSAALAAPGEHPGPKAGSAEFERIKSLAGEWEGQARETGQDDQMMSVSYEITSGGNAVVERLHKGTPNEMVSVYYDDPEGKLGMTHYCMLPNRPQLELTGSSPEKIDLELDPSDPMNQTGEPHMHALSIVFAGPDQIEQRWMGHEGGEPKEPTVISLRRKISSAAAH